MLIGRVSPALLLALAAACGAPGRSGHAREADEPLFVRTVASMDPVAPGGDHRAPLVVPGAAWIDGDLAPLARRHAVFAYDQRGRGRSPAIDADLALTIDDDVRDLERLRIELSLERMDLLGWSYSAAVVLRYALAHPERVNKLIVVSPFPAHHEEWLAYLHAFTLRADREAFAEIDGLRRSGAKERDLEGYARRVLDASLDVFLANPEARATMRSDPVALPNLDPDDTARLAAGIVASLGEWNWTPELRALQAPVLVVHGERGLLPLASARRYVEGLERAELLRLEGAGHMPWLDAPQAFFAGVTEFLERDDGP